MALFWELFNDLSIYLQVNKALSIKIVKVKRISSGLIIFSMFCSQLLCGQNYEYCFSRQSLLTIQKSSLDKVRIYLTKNLFEFDGTRTNDDFQYDDYSINYSSIYWNRSYPSAEFILYHSAGKSNIIIYNTNFGCFNEILTSYSSVLKGKTEVENGDLFTKFKEGNVVTEFRESGGDYSTYSIVLYNETELKIEVKTQKDLDEAREKEKQEQERLFESAKLVADELFEAGKFDEAKLAYSKAYDIKADEYILFRIDLCTEKICNLDIEKADSAFIKKQFEDAIIGYNKVLNCAKNKLQIEEKIKKAEADLLNAKVYNLMKEADLNMDNKKFDAAANYYNKILQLDPLNKVAQDKIKRINTIKDILSKRSTTVFSYKSMNPVAFSKFKDTILERLKYAITDKRSGNVRMTYLIDFDTLGKNKSTSTIAESSSKELSRNLNYLIANKCLTPTSEIGFYLASAEKIDINLEWYYKTVSCKSKYGIIHSLDEDHSSFGSNILRTYILNSEHKQGKFTFGIVNKELNGQKYTDITLLKYRPKGPFNAIHSVLIPGWGSHIVSNGESGKSRLKVFLWSSGLSFVSKLYSNSQYEKYKQANTQSEMDKYYGMANFSQKLFLVTGAIGVSIYVYDIYWSFRRGLKNYAMSKNIRQDIKMQPRKIINQPLNFQ